MDAAPITWRPLGRLLVDKGLLSDEELERALEEQERTGKRLGEILTDRGYLSGPALSHALAEQYGVDLTVEGGFGSGLRREIERRHQAKRPVLRIVRQDAEPEILEVPEPGAEDELSLVRDRLADAESRLAELLPHLEEQWARLVSAQSLLAERDARIAELQAQLAAEDATVGDPLIEQLQAAAQRATELEAQLGEAQALVGERDAQLEEARATVAAREPQVEELARLEAELSTAHARVAELEHQLAETRALLVARDARFAAVENELERLARAEARVAQLEAELAARPQPQPETSHLLFVPGAETYGLVEAEGPSPAPGASVERDGIRFVVMRNGRAPFPGDRRRCAYLVAVGPETPFEESEDSTSSFGSASSLYPTP